MLAEAKICPPSLPPLWMVLLLSATNAPHSIWLTVTSIPIFFSEDWTTRVVATNSGYCGEHLMSTVKPFG